MHGIYLIIPGIQIDKSYYNETRKAVEWGKDKGYLDFNLFTLYPVPCTLYPFVIHLKPQATRRAVAQRAKTEAILKPKTCGSIETLG